MPILRGIGILQALDSWQFLKARCLVGLSRKCVRTRPEGIERGEMIEDAMVRRKLNHWIFEGKTNCSGGLPDPPTSCSGGRSERLSGFGCPSEGPSACPHYAVSPAWAWAVIGQRLRNLHAKPLLQIATLMLLQPPLPPYFITSLWSRPKSSFLFREKIPYFS